MRRFSRKSFSQIMVSNQLKNKLEQLKDNITINNSIKYPISFGDSISFLLNQYYNSQKIKQNKLLVKKSIEKQALIVSIPLKKTQLITSSKFNQKNWIVRKTVGV